MEYKTELISTETCHDGFFRLNRYQLRHSLYAGGWSQPLVRERVERLRAVSVLLYDAERDSVVMVEQFRIGALERNRGAWLLETVGGMVEPGECPESVARRESIEETGCEPMELLPVCDFYASPGTATERIQLFCGRVRAGIGGEIRGIAEEGEDIRVEVLTATEAFAELYTGRINSTSAIIATQWLALNRERLRQIWC